MVWVMLCLAGLAVAIVMFAPSLSNPCDGCARDEKRTCRAGCPEYQQYRDKGEWS